VSRVLIVNTSTVSNHGDAAILEGLIASLRAAGATYITVAALADPTEVENRLAMGADEVVPLAIDTLRAPRWMRRTYPGLAVWVACMIPLTLLRAGRSPDTSLRSYRDADLVISSGGGYLGGERPGANVLNVFHIALAEVLGRRCLVAPITVKPMNSTVKRIVKIGLKGALVFARDVGTLHRLRELGLRPRLASDMAFRSPSLLAAATRARPAHRGFVIAWAPRQYGSGHTAFAARQQIYSAALRALCRLARLREARIVLISQSGSRGLEDDVPFVERLARSFPPDVHVDVMPHARTLDQGMKQFAEADVLLSFRLHAAIMALAAGTPTLVVGYEPKVQGVLEPLGLGDWVLDPAGPWNSDLLADSLANLARPESVGRIELALERAGHGYQEFDSALRHLLRSTEP
jgi:colanic acid/amylovoran biosynthesis protein WcaK/AmsJ